ncbi:MAG: hypothetical protein KDD50_15490 [Bdellovibrionales bacterium]|nr:hypothetical protein [Bdellovibrionales bacterium]
MRIKFNLNETLPLHVTGKLVSGYLDGKEKLLLWNMLCDEINGLQRGYRLLTHALVLMGNHYHWVCSYDVQKDPYFFQFFEEMLNMAMAGAISRKYRFTTLPKINPVRNFPQYKTLYRYVYRNPIDAGFVSKAHYYPYSSLFYLVKNKKLGFELRDNMNFITDPFNTLMYVNEACDGETTNLYLESENEPMVID